MTMPVIRFKKVPTGVTIGKRLISSTLSRKSACVFQGRIARNLQISPSAVINVIIWTNLCSDAMKTDGTVWGLFKRRLRALQKKMLCLETNLIARSTNKSQVSSMKSKHQIRDNPEMKPTSLCLNTTAMGLTLIGKVVFVVAAAVGSSGLMRRRTSRNITGAKWNGQHLWWY